ncbi:hypothetical protein JHK87_027666 [Glycine soja]|nr:hypothetical protein JHK87_027666 [Glycine soja]
MEAEAENNDVKKEENNNDNNNNNESNGKIGNSSECLSKPKRQMKMPFQLEMLEKAYVGLLSTPNLSIREAMVTNILLGKNDNVEGVCTFFGMKFYAPSVILTTRTFMSGKIWVGRTSMPAGRVGESASLGLTKNLQRLGFETDRLKNGTPA